MGRMFAVVVASIALASCAEQPWVWAQSGNAAMPLQQAQYECERDTRMSAASFGYGVMAQVYARDFAVRCMGSKGWYQQTVGAAPTPAAYGSQNPAARQRYVDCLAQARTNAAAQACAALR